VAVNGDDALAVAPAEKLDAARANLTALGLRVHTTKKCFRTRPILDEPGRDTAHGVFCERHALAVVKQGRVRVTARAEMRLAEAGGTAKVDGLVGPGAVDTLLGRQVPPKARQPHKLVRWLARRTGTAAGVGGHGPMWAGGGGRGAVDAIGFSALARFGAFAPRTMHRTPEERFEEAGLPIHRRTVAFAEVAGPGSQRLSKILASQATELGQRRLLEGRAVAKRKPVTSAELRDTFRRRAICARQTTPLQALGTLECSLLYSKEARRRAAQYVRVGKLGRAARSLQRDDPWVAAGSFVDPPSHSKSVLRVSSIWSSWT